MPVAASQRPETVDQVRLLRAEGQNGEAVFAAEYGEQEGQRRLQEWGVASPDGEDWELRPREC